MKLTALIPVYNDDYTLCFCLASIVNHFDEILILDDASTDDTPDVAVDFARRHSHVRYHRHKGPQLGWIEARNRLAALTESTLLFWLDSDDVLCEYNALLLRRIAEGPQPLVRLQLTEMWGDLCHTTGRLRHYDRCHTFVNRRVMREFAWTGGTCARLTVGARHAVPARSITAHSGPGPLFFHLKGVKPDRRLVERQRIRGYLGAKDRPERLEAFVGARHAVPIEELSDAQIHQLALHTLLRSRQDHLTPTYTEKGAPGAPRRPEVIEAALPGRFRIVYSAEGEPVDRIELERIQ